MTADTEQRSYRDIGLGRAWFGLAAGPLVWALYHMLVYAVVSLACKWNMFQWQVLGLSGARFILIALTLVSVGVVAYAGWLSWRGWQRLRGETTREGDPPGGRFSFMAFLGLLLSGLFTVTIVVTGVPALVLDLCATL